jgi:hypothetical protein
MKWSQQPRVTSDKRACCAQTSLGSAAWQAAIRRIEQQLQNHNKHRHLLQWAQDQGESAKNVREAIHALSCLRIRTGVREKIVMATFSTSKSRKLPSTIRYEALTGNHPSRGMMKQQTFRLAY